MSKDPKSNPSREQGTSGKSYATPKVRSYGNIHDITLGTGHNGNTDMTGGPHKTLP